MKKLLAFVSVFLIVLSASAIENLSWENRSLSAGKVDVVTGGYSITKTLAVANLSPEFRMPVQIVYDSLNMKPGVFGDGWRCPQLESRVFPRENGMEWTSPWGEKIAFFEKEKGKGLYSPYSEWEATGSQGNWTIKHKEGWKFDYKSSYLREISSPANRKLTFEYVEKDLSKVVQNNQVFVEIKYSKDGTASEIFINGEKFSFDYVKSQVPVLPDKLGLQEQVAEKIFLSSIRNGKLNPLQCKYNEDGYLAEISNGQTVEKLVTQKETFDQRREFLKKAEEANKKANRSNFQEVRMGRLLKDRDYDYSYTPDGTVTIKNSDGQTSSVSYNMMRGVLKVRDFSGLASEIYYFRRYDVAYNGKLRQIRDSRDRTVLNCRYDKDTGKPLIVRDMTDNEIYYSYDKNENVTMISRSESDNPRRPLLSFKYDGNKNPIAIEMLDKAGKSVYATRFQYDQHSQVVSVETEEANYKFQYNAFGFIVKSSDIFGRGVSREYDQFNRLSSMVDANGICIAYSYSGSRLAGIEKYSSADKKELLSSINFTYDNATGNLIGFFDNKGRNCKFDRNAEGRIIAEYYPDNTVVRYSLDAKGRLEEVRDQNNNPIRFAYNKFGNIASRTTAVGQMASYQYSQFGLLESLKKGQGGIATQEISYSYDEFDRCIRIAYGNGQEKNIKYDSRGKVLRIEDATKASADDIYSHIAKTIQSVDFVYDQFDRVISKTYTKATIPFKQFASEKKEEKTTHEYTYTPSGKRRSLVVTFADGSKKITEWIYDKFGRLEKIRDNGQEIVYKYDAKSRLSEKIIAGISEFYQYDNQGRLVRKALGSFEKPIADLKYAYSKDGSVASREVNGKLQNYEYDVKGQLLAVRDAKGNAVEQYIYDPAGNILKKTVDGKTTIFSYDEANQLVTATMPDGSKKTFEYDGAGRLAKEGNKTYSYGWLDKVLKVEENGNSSNFDYFADGQLAERTSKGIEEDFAWDGLALIRRDKVDYTIEPHPNGGNAILANGKMIFNDMLGSSLGTVENGAFSEIDRTSFGSAHAVPATDFFTGKPNVEGLGYAFLFRNYRSEIGKWQTADPFGYPDGWNNLAYVNNRTMKYYDFLGAWSEAAHNAFINHVYNGVISPTYISRLQAGAAWVDSGEGNQSNERSYMHGMRGPNQSIEDATLQTQQFIEGHVAAARYIVEHANESNRDEALNDALFELGKAYHAMQDSLSPVHRDSNGNPLIWDENNPLTWPGHSPNDFLGNEKTSNITQNNYLNSDVLMQQYMLSAFHGTWAWNKLYPE